jgi:uncharacterized protein (DUF488 family)
VKLFTIGHSTRSAAELIALLAEAQVNCVVDVRSIPRSRKNPQFNRDSLPQSLAAAEIAYVHMAALGGRRSRSGPQPSPNTLWRNDAFRNFADYAASAVFRTGLEELKALAERQCCAIMCAEAVWWRCHRRIIADYLLAEGIEVAHIMGAGKIEAATLTPGARPLPDGTLLYAAPTELSAPELG